MECTQRLECTQDLYSSNSERVHPEQIGFLGICGEKFPVLRGPNKIGRDPQTCGIVLNRNSISRQHAVINVLNGKQFMLMDLGSANKTKLNNKSLPPYIPSPLSNGDTVQFGEIFGIFQLLEDESDLPMTQAIDIPETPIFSRGMSRVKPGITTIPESPDVSDREESFIVPSQPKVGRQLPNNKFIKASDKLISIQPIGTNKIDNAYWNSSKKSSSFNMDESNTSLNDPVASSSKNDTPHINNNLYEMQTQMPGVNESADSIYDAATQLPTDHNASPSIYSLDTQLPTPDDLPIERKLRIQQDIKINIADNKENDNSLYNAETQLPAENVVAKQENTDESIYDAVTQLPYLEDKNNSNNIYNAATQLPEERNNSDIYNAETQLPALVKDTIFTADTQLPTNAEIQPPSLVTEKENNANDSRETCKDKFVEEVNKSNDPILFDEIDSQSFLEGFDSQPLLPQEDSPEDENVIPLSQDSQDYVIKVSSKASKRVNRIESDSTDCEDIDVVPPKTMPSKPMDDDITDCEDNDIEIEPNKLKDPEFKTLPLEEVATQIVEENLPRNSPVLNLEDMPTQVIADVNVVNDVSQTLDDQNPKEITFEEMPTQVIPNKEEDFESMATQVIDEIPPLENSCEDSIKNECSEEIVNLFKVPSTTPRKAKKKDTSKANELNFTNSNIPTMKSPIKVVNLTEDDEQYYAATQDIFDDLCTQREASPEGVSDETSRTELCNTILKQNQVEIIKYDASKDLSPKKILVCDKSSESSDGDEKVNAFVSNLTTKQIKEVIGVDAEVANVKRVPSDPSDVEVTPKKVRPFKFLQTELPDSQEIKTSVSMSTKILVTDSSSDSEPEQNSEDQHTPILFRKKKRVNETKIDLTKKFDLQALPTRVITRVRKPTSKLQASDEGTKKRGKTILKQKFLSDEDDVDKEIITENISRLKTKTEKKNNKDNTKDLSISKEVKKESRSRRKKDTTNDKKVEENKIKPETEKTVSRSKTRSKEEKISKEKEPKAIDSKNNESLPHRSRSGRNTRNSQNIEIEIIGETTSPPEKQSTRRSRKKDNDKIDEKADSQNDSKNGNPEITTLSAEPTKRTRKSKDKNKTDLDDSAKEIKKRGRKPKKTDKKEDTITDTANVITDGDVSKTTDIRRSKRQQINTTETKRSTRAKKSNPAQDQSTVYNISSESGADSPRPAKRPAGDYEAPSPKRTRSGVNSNTSKVSSDTSKVSSITSKVSSNTSSAVSSNSSSMRSTPARGVKTQYVLFTAFPYEEVKTKLESLGAVVVSDVMSCTVVLTLQIKRTFKLLCAVGLGKPIVGPDWVQACNDTSMIIDPWLYLINDEASEKRFKYSLSRTLSGKRNFLKGYHVSATPNVMPSAPEMKLIVECSGGTWQASGPKWVCISCAADRALWPQLKERGAIVVSSEFILSGVLRQTVDIAGNLLKVSGTGPKIKYTCRLTGTLTKLDIESNINRTRKRKT